MRLPVAVMSILVAVSGAGALAQRPDGYVVPRTEYGQPDFQGIWKTEFLTTLERMPGADGLTVTPEQARKLAEAFLEKSPVLTDPDTKILGLDQLAKVNGEYRTSLIVDPPDGKMPLTPAGTERITRVQTRTKEKFDNPEERSMGEQCLENFTYAPLRSIPVMLTRQVVQTRDYVLISGEDIPGPRIIHLRPAVLPDWQRTIAGYSAGHWEGNTLIVETTHLLAAEPIRAAATRALAISPRTTITERFTRVSPTELFYRFTVRDDELYTRPWSGEFSLTREDGPIYEYACHEANYSMTNMLRGGRVQDKEAK
jgi:hypothetical protein